jgi:hypothetical protein
MWEFKMRAYLREIGCAASLFRSNMLIDVNDENERKKNDKAYSRLAMAMKMDDVVGSQIVKRSVSTVYPDGDAAVAWRALANRYEPKKAVDKQTLFAEMFATKLEDISMDPEIWIMELQRKQSKLFEMGERVSDGLLMCHILGNLPSEYENVADQLANDELKTIESVIVTLKDKFERMKINGKSSPTGETALVGFKKFNGVCRYCGKKGHKATDCFKKRADERNKNGVVKDKKGFHGNCHHCGKKGHKKADCFQLQNKKESEENGAVVLIAETITESGSLMCTEVQTDIAIDEVVNGRKGSECIRSSKAANSLIKQSWADMCDTSVEESENDDDDVPDLLSAGSASSADDWGDDFETDEDDYEDDDLDTRIVFDIDYLSEGDEICLASDLTDVGIEYMIADTGATVHMRKNTDGMYDLRHEKCVVKYGNGSSSTSTVVGKWAGFVNNNGVRSKVILENVTVVPGSAYNLFSLTRVLCKGTITSDGEMMQLICNGVTIKFDHRIETSNGFLLAAKFDAVDQEPDDIVCVSMKARSKIKAADLHAKLGHVNDDYMRLTAKEMGLEVTGSLKTCESCAIGKAKQQSVPKHDDRVFKHPGELIYMDIAGIKKPSKGKKKFWVLFMDAFSGCIVSRFIQSKRDLAVVGIEVLRTLDIHGIKVQAIRCDNAGENKVLEATCQKEGMQIMFEYTAPGTPQQNGVAERMFATLFGRVRAMNTAAGLTTSLRNQLWAEAANCATDINNLIIRKKGDKSPYELFFGKPAPYMPHLRTFGEVGVIRNITSVKEKLQDRGSTCMFVGYAAQHAGNVYRMYNFNTGQLRLSRDVQWMGLLYTDYNPTSSFGIREDDAFGNGEDEVHEDDADEYDISKTRSISAPDDPQDEQTKFEPSTGYPVTTELDDGWCTVKVGRTTLKYEDRPSGQTRTGSVYKPSEPSNEIANVASNSYSVLYDSDEEVEEHGDHDDPTTFEAAWNHPSVKERTGWRGAIRKEFQDMNKRAVWRRVKRDQVPDNKRVIGCKWVFKHKKDGRYRARLCALGYSQVPGEDYMDTASPVVDDITVRMVVTKMMANNWESEIVDITTAFLHGPMEEKVFMNCPEGIDLIEEGWDRLNDCTELMKTIYGTKQAARQFWKTFMTTMERRGFERTHVDSCLLKRKDESGTVLICVYVDDCLITGDRTAIHNAINDIESTFETRRVGTLNEYIGCTFLDMKNGSIKLIQPDMIKKMEKTFGGYMADIRDTNTPMGPGLTVIRPNDGDKRVDQLNQREFRSGVGMLLYLVKHSRPDLSNAVRELSKVMDGATNDHLNLLHRVVKFVLSTRDRGILMKPVPEKGVVAYVDSDYAGDKENRKSISGYLIYLHGVPIAWKSKQQGGVTLSSSEAEYYAISEVATELKFIAMIMEFIEIELSEPMKVYVDNIGAIHLANNASSGVRTKHIDTRIHFVRELTQGDNKLLDIEFVRSEENQSDTFTKNTTSELFWKHTNKYMVDAG